MEVNGRRPSCFVRVLHNAPQESLSKCILTSCESLAFRDIKRARFEPSLLQKYPKEDRQCSLPGRLNIAIKKAPVFRHMPFPRPKCCAWNLVLLMNLHRNSVTGHSLPSAFPIALLLPAAHDKQLAAGFTQQMAGTGAYVHLLVSGTSWGWMV